MAVAEAFATGCTPGREPGSAVITVQLPRRHFLYRPLAGRHDGMVLVEAWRQAVICLAHLVHTVPTSYRFTLQSLTLDLLDGPLPVAWTHPTELALHVRSVEAVERDGVVTSLRVAATFYHEERAVAVGSCYTRILPPDVYDALRRRARNRTNCDAPDHTALRTATSLGDAAYQSENVVLSPGGGGTGAHGQQWELIVNPGHPVFFDHPHDHVPGMLILEGFRQAAHLTAGDRRANLTSLATAFTAFAELDAPVTIAVEPDPIESDAYTAMCLQHGQTLATATLRLGPSGGGTAPENTLDELVGT